MAKTDQELAQEEMASRQYMYGGTGPFSQFISGERREILSPESTQVLGFASGPSGVEYITETIPAQYGPAEYDPSYSPVRRGLSALGDMLGEAPSFLGFRGPDEQAEAIQGVGSSLRDALFGTSEYMSEQARAAASGGEYFDPETGRTVAFDPTIVMGGGSSGGGPALASGFRRSGNEIGDTLLYSGGGRQGTAIAAGSALRNELEKNFRANQFPTTFDQRVLDAYSSENLDPRIFKTGAGGTPRVNPQVIEQNIATDIQYGDNRIQEVPFVNLEDYEGYGFMSPMADTSGAGDVIQTINGVPVNVSRRGGIDFMLDPESGDLVWASDENVIKGKRSVPSEGTFMGIANALKEKTGKDPLFAGHSMTPTGVDYSQVSEVMLNYAKNNMDGKTINELNKDIKRIFPDWRGLNTEGAISDLNRVSGNFRKKVIQLLDKEYTDKGSINAGQARLSLIDEKQRILRPGTVLNLGIVDTSRAPIVGNPHPIYNTGMYGEGLGRVSVPFSVYELNPQAAYLSGIRPDQLMNPPRQTGRQGGLRSLEGSPLTGVITEDVLRGMEARRAQ